MAYNAPDVQGREQVATQIEDIERTAAAELRKKGLQPLGVPAILKSFPAFHKASDALIHFP